MNEISARLDHLDNRLSIVEKKPKVKKPSKAAEKVIEKPKEVATDAPAPDKLEYNTTLRLLNEVVSHEVDKIKGLFMSKAGFDKFSNATVDALEKEKERIVKLESLTQ